MDKPEILCIGHIAYDLIFTVDGYPMENAKVIARDRAMGGGGPAANAACLCAAWGSNVSWIGHVGDDFFGERLFSEFEAYGVDVSRAVVRTGHPTPVSAIVVNAENGSRTIVNHRRPDHVQHGETSLNGLDPKVILVDGHEPPMSTVAISTFPGAISILDGGSLNDFSIELAKAVDYPVVSEAFAEEVSGISPIRAEIDREQSAKTVSSVIGACTAVTFGEYGCWYSDSDNDLHHIPALKVEPVDTTGAGDIFHGACAWALAHDYEFGDALKLATVAAGISVSVPGGRTSIPNLDDVISHPLPY